MKNLFRSIPQHLPEELFETLAESSQVRVERIVSRRHITPQTDIYDQAWDEWVVLLQGEARLWLEDQPIEVCLSPGDYLLIKAHTKHRVTYTSEASDTIWLAVHFLA